jgi:hypothetical protein
MMMMILIDVPIATDTDVAIQANRNVTQNDAEKKLQCYNKEHVNILPNTIGRLLLRMATRFGHNIRLATHCFKRR